MRLSATALSGFGVFFGVSFAGGPRGLLPTVMLARHGEKDTMSPQQLDFKNFHGPHTVSLRRWPSEQRHGKARDIHGSSSRSSSSSAVWCQDTFAKVASN